MLKTNRYFFVVLLAVAVLGLFYTVIQASAVSGPLAHQVSDQDAGQLVGGSFCVRLRKGKCSAYYATPEGQWHRTPCPKGRPANIATTLNCGTRRYVGVDACGGKIPQDQQLGKNYVFGGWCIKILTVTGCISSEDPIPVTPDLDGP